MAAVSDRTTERRTSPVELLWDLVFAFAVTQVITLLLNDPTWRGVGRSMLALALVWWAWSAFVWVANAFDDEARTLRLVVLGAGGVLFFARPCVPPGVGARPAPF